MAKTTRFVGMDVHAETIAVAVVEGRNTARSVGTIPNTYQRLAFSCEVLKERSD